MHSMGINELNKVYSTEDLAPGKRIVFAATGVTDGTLLKGVRFFSDGVRTHSLLMNLAHRVVRFVDTVYLADRPDIQVRF
jgi:fructose-1,6-bisphosphatase/sedoheptulose 1,7-bisphosphatase-like protein